MDLTTPNGCSREPLCELCDVPKDLSHHAALFVKLCDKKEDRMRDLLRDIKEMDFQIKKWHTKSKRSCYTGAVSAGVTIGAGIAVPFAGGLGFAITAALTSVAAGGALFGFKIKQFRTEEDCLKKIKDFLKIVNRLQHELEEIMKVCESLQRESEKAETEKVCSLRNNLVKLFESTENLRTADKVKELTGQCPKVFEEFQDIKTQLVEFRGSTDTENTQTELENSSENSSESPVCGDKTRGNSTLMTDGGSSETENLQKNRQTENLQTENLQTENLQTENRQTENRQTENRQTENLQKNQQTENLQTELESYSENSSELSPLFLQQQDNEGVK